MVDYRLFRDIVTQLAHGHGDAGRDLLTRIPDDQVHAYHTFVTGAYSVLTATYFAQDSGPEALRRFVDGMRHDYRRADPPLKTLVVEGLLRAFYGEDHLIDEIDPMDQLRHQLMAIRKMVFEDEALAADLDGHLAQAESLTRQWLAALGDEAG